MKKILLFLVAFLAFPISIYASTSLNYKDLPGLWTGTWQTQSKQTQRIDILVKNIQFSSPDFSCTAKIQVNGGPWKDLGNGYCYGEVNHFNNIKYLRIKTFQLYCLNISVYSDSGGTLKSRSIQGIGGSIGYGNNFRLYSSAELNKQY